jgi:hypothetical protein
MISVPESLEAAQKELENLRKTVREGGGIHYGLVCFFICGLCVISGGRELLRQIPLRVLCLNSGVLGCLFLTRVIPVFLPNRWGGEDRYARIAFLEGFTASKKDLPDKRYSTSTSKKLPLPTRALVSAGPHHQCDRFIGDCRPCFPSNLDQTSQMLPILPKFFL